jgi:hypothetical protein
MPRRMYDSTTPWDIPRDAEMVAYYVDGRYAWPQAWLDLFPRAVKVSISAIGTRTAQVGDVEIGCIWPPVNAVPWVLRARADGYDPTIYVNQMNDWAPTRAAFRAAGVPEPHYWVANYDGVPVIPTWSVAKQYAHPHDGDGVANRPWETGKHYDLSIAADFWPGVDAKDAARGGGAGAPNPEGLDMIIELPPSAQTTGKVLALDPTRNWRIVIASSSDAGWVGHFYNWRASNDNQPDGTGGDPVGTDQFPQDGGRVDINEPWTYDVPSGTAKCAFEYSSNGVVSVGVYPR